MIPYNQKNPFSYIFTFHKADTFRKLLPFFILYVLYTWAVAYFCLSYQKISPESYVTNIDVMHSLLGVAISVLLVFRTNTAYDRWWEGRKLWGSLVNNSRNLATKLCVLLPEEDKENREFFKKTLIAYPFALHDHLNKENTRTELFLKPEHKQVLQHVDVDKHIPNQLIKLLMQRVMELLNKGIITGEQLLFINAEIQSYTDICGACERIKNSPIPFSYSVFIKKFIFIYVITLPFGYVFNLGYWVILVASFIFYVQVSMELIAEEIEDPFGGDQNDVPTDLISKSIQKNIQEIL